MIYRKESALGGRVDRKLRRAVKEMHGGCELLADDAETLAYEIEFSVRGQAWGEILKQIRAEAEAVLNMAGRVEALLDEGAGVVICRS